MTYRCPKCGMESEKPKNCEMCDMLMEEVCESCGKTFTECDCGKDTEKHK